MLLCIGIKCGNNFYVMGREGFFRLLLAFLLSEEVNRGSILVPEPVLNL